MSKLRFNITMTLDGYVAGPNQSVENGLGEGGERMHDWVVPLKTFREIHGDEGGGETGTNDDVLREAFENIGATIMGRNMFGPVRGPWGKDPWRGWWGDNPPFHTPVFVLTHHAREPLVMQGGNLPLRHGRNRVGTQAGEGGGRRQGRGARRRSQSRAAVPRRRADG